MPETNFSISKAHWDAHYAAPGTAHHSPEHLPFWYQMARRLMGHVAGKTILEAGCGSGAFSETLAREGARVTAFDITAEGILHAGRQGKFGFARARAEAMPFRDESFDRVVSCEILHLTENPEKAVAESFRVLKPGGLLVLTCASHFNLWGLYRLYCRLRKKPIDSGQGVFLDDHTFMPWQLEGFLKRAGFRVQARAGIGLMLFWPGRAPRMLVRPDEREPLHRSLRPFCLHLGFFARRP